MATLDSIWFNQHSICAAEKLIGCYLIANNRTYLIVETEAYRGTDDPASHAYRGVTTRNEPMFQNPGHIYVYLIYGMHHCLNITTEEKGTPGAVLIRGIYDTCAKKLISGPGRVCKELQIDLRINRRTLAKAHLRIIAGIELQVTRTSRIGIKVGTDLKWRFCAKDLSTDAVQKAVHNSVDKLDW